MRHGGLRGISPRLIGSRADLLRCSEGGRRLGLAIPFPFVVAERPGIVHHVKYG